MRRSFALAALFVALALGGCIDPSQPDSSPTVDLLGEFFAPSPMAALWNDPQQFPHPAFNWPTLTHVPPNAPKWWQPIPPHPVPNDITGMSRIATAGSGSTVDGIAVFGSLVVSPAGLVYDISNPEDPKVLSELDPRPGGRTAVIIPYPDGRLVVAFATGSGDIPIYDITDPTQPDLLTVFDVPSGGHSIGVVPGTPILYNANAVGSRYYPHELSGSRSISQVEIYDLTNPDDPILVQEWKNGYGCHMVSFYVNPEAGKLRGYCAAVDATQVWDITDPRAPTVITTIPMPHGQETVPGYPILAAVSHFAIVNDDATTLAVADEFMGGAAPACDFYLRQSGRTLSGPAGNIYFYDITEEKEPTLLGWINPGAHFTYYDNPTASCTAHIGHLIPHEDRDLLAMAFYGGGVAVIDFTDGQSPFIAAHWTEAEPMDVWYYNGYLIAGDASQGIDVLTLT